MKKIPTEVWIHEHQLGAARIIADYRRKYADDTGLCDLLDLCEQLVWALAGPEPDAPAPERTLAAEMETLQAHVLLNQELLRKTQAELAYMRMLTERASRRTRSSNGC